MNKQSIPLPGSNRKWGTYVSKYQPDSSEVLDNMFTSGSKNFITDQTGMIDKRQGGVQWNRTSFGNAAQDTYEAIFTSGARHFLRVGGGTLSASTGTGLFDTITSGYSTLGNFEWATYQNRVYGDNGINSPQTYDTATSYGGVTYSFTTGKTKVMGAQAPNSAPTSGAYTAGGSVPVGSHTYKVTFLYYGAEESNGSPASAVQTATSGFQTGNLSAIPIGGYGVTARIIYRDNNDGVWLQLATISDNTTTVYVDTLASGATPTPIPTTNNVPPTFTKIALWLDSLFIAPAGQTNILNFSLAGSPDIFPPSNFVTCQSDDVITALYVYNGKLYVFGLHSFGTIEGNTPDTFFYRNINNFIGCVDNRSIQVRSIVSIPTLWWLSTKGFYYSNGYTVEYGSDFIQDLINLNISQVNFTTGKNTQQSFTDWSGDASSPSIDLNSNPGVVNVLNPQKTYSTTNDWLGGLSLSNLKTAISPFLEVPTIFSPALGQGVLSGQAQISGSNLTLPSQSSFTGESHATVGTKDWQSDATNTRYFANKLAQSFVPSLTGTLNTLSGFNFRAYWANSSGNWTLTISVNADGGGIPGGALASASYSFPTVFSTTQSVPATTLNVALNGGTTYWIVLAITPKGNDGQFSGFEYSTGWSSGQNAVGANLIGVWSTVSPPQDPTPQMLAGAYTYTTSAVGATGSWTSPIYDSGAPTSVSGTIVESGSYPGTSSGSVVVYGSNNANMTGATSQSTANPNGATAFSLTNFRYWQIVVNLVAPTPISSVPTMGTPSLTFSITGTWISQPVSATADNTGWGTLTFTGSVPNGTSVTLTIATSPDNITYSSFGPIGSAATQPFAKVKIVISTDVNNTTTPAVSSVTLTWNLTAQIVSTPIDTGTTPSGFGVVQWNQPNTNGTVTFYIRTASTSLGLAAASYVTVANGAFPNLTALEFLQWKMVFTATANNTPSVTSVTVNWFTSSGTVGVRVASLFFNKTYYVSLATTGATSNNTLIQMDQFGNWRIQKDVSIGTFLSYSNTLFFTDGILDKIFNGFISSTDNGTAIAMDVRTKAWSANNDLFLKIPRALKLTALNTGTTIHAFYSTDRGATFVEMLNERGNFGLVTTTDGSEFTILFVPDEGTLVAGRTLMYRITSVDTFPCSIINYVPSFYSRKGRYLSHA
jgi:hypothetical protein